MCATFHGPCYPSDFLCVPAEISNIYCIRCSLLGCQNATTATCPWHSICSSHSHVSYFFAMLTFHWRALCKRTIVVGSSKRGGPHQLAVTWQTKQNPGAWCEVIIRCPSYSEERERVFQIMTGWWFGRTRLVYTYARVYGARGIHFFAGPHLRYGIEIINGELTLVDVYDQPLILLFLRFWTFIGSIMEKTRFVIIWI